MDFNIYIKTFIFIYVFIVVHYMLEDNHLFVIQPVIIFYIYNALILYLRIK